MSVSPIPSHYSVIMPYLIVRNAAEALEFYQRAFNGEETMRLAQPGGLIGHAEIVIDGFTIMLADEYPDMGAVGPETLGGSGISLTLYVEDVDARFNQAIEAGATELRPVADQFYGDRAGTLKDPFGHVWTIMSRIEDLSVEEIEKRMVEAAEQN